MGVATVLAAGVSGILIILGSVIVWWLRHQDKRADELQERIQQQQARMEKQQAQIERLEARDRLGWIYIQRLILSHTTHAPNAPLPAPPAGWLDDDQ